MKRDSVLIMQIKPWVGKSFGHKLLISILRRQGKEDLCESEASLIYMMSFRTAGTA